MTLQVPPPLERRIRRKWSRRAKLIGYGVVALYVGILLAHIWLFDSGAPLFYIVTFGCLIAARYLQVARLVERAEEQTPVVDEATRKILGDYEAKIREEGRREVASGTLSIPATPEESGALSSPDDE